MKIMAFRLLPRTGQWTCELLGQWENKRTVRGFQGFGHSKCNVFPVVNNS